METDPSTVHLDAMASKVEYADGVAKISDLVVTKEHRPWPDERVMLVFNPRLNPWAEQQHRVSGIVRPPVFGITMGDDVAKVEYLEVEMDPPGTWPGPKDTPKEDVYGVGVDWIAPDPLDLESTCKAIVQLQQLVENLMKRELNR